MVVPNQVTVRVETEVVLDINVMAKAFAHMNSDEQARFFALAHQQMATYQKEKPDGTMDELGSYGREMQMLSIKDCFDEQPDAREFILSLYQMTIEEEEDTFTDVAKEASKRMDLVAPGTYDMSTQPLKVISESLSWKGQHGEKRMPFGKPQVTCHCKGLIGMWYKIDDRVKVETSPSMERWGTVTVVRHDNTVDVRLDAELPPPITSKTDLGDLVRRVRGGGHTTYITVKADSLDFEGNAAYIKGGAGIPGAYVGSVSAVHPNGTVTIRMDPGPLPYDPDQPLPIGTVASVDRPVKEGELITSDDLVSPNDDTAPNVAERRQCDECKGTGTWTSPFTDETTPCSRGCKS